MNTADRERPIPTITDHDQLIKTLLKTFFREYLELFLPDLAAQLLLDDPDHPVMFLDKELFTDFPTGDRRHLDVFARVWTRQGTAEHILIHNETQETNDALQDVSPYDPRALQWLLDDKKPLPLGLRMLLYTAQTQQLHFPTPVIPIATWFVPGKGQIGLRRCDYTPYGAGLGVSYFCICLPDLFAEDYLSRDNPVAYGLAVRMRPRQLSKVGVALASRRLILRDGRLSPLQRDLLWNFSKTYATLSPTEEHDMQAQMEKAEDRDLQEADLTWAGKHYYHGIKDGRTEGRTETLRQSIKDLVVFLPAEVTPERQDRLANMTLPELDALWKHLLTHRTWPQDR